ncbi:hypothetical protein GOP47_0021737 [Adiantum capillus-veneris]|uniref:Uncharacterized protein n=1 Tax=Adiantum capillus-veneris TaxID=13818 RepID=A0A9D4Z6U4_ADICA|nr:hypothetical protein GOP47_0021737 [Adiantum capillus-veneris]
MITKEKLEAVLIKSEITGHISRIFQDQNKAVSNAAQSQFPHVILSACLHALATGLFNYSALLCTFRMYVYQLAPCLKYRIGRLLVWKRDVGLRSRGIAAAALISTCPGYISSSVTGLYLNGE